MIALRKILLLQHHLSLQADVLWMKTILVPTQITLRIHMFILRLTAEDTMLILTARGLSEPLRIAI